MIDELYKEGRDYEYFTRMREAEMQNEAYRQSEQEAKEIIAELKQENKELKEETLQWKQIKDMANNNKYRSVLEEIRKCINLYLAVDSDFINSETYLRIKDELEVLG